MADIALASTDGSSFAITIDDTSPTIVYSPFADTFGAPNLTAGWNPYFSGSHFATDPTIGQTGSGVSFHVTSADGASLAIRWNGTAVVLYGFFPLSSPAFPSISYSVSLDGVATTNYALSISSDPDSEDNILASFTNLTNDEHLVELNMHNPDNLLNGSILLRFDRAVITSRLPKQSTPEPVTTLSYPDELVSYRGQWSFNSQLLPDQNLSFHTSTNVGDCASLLFNGTSISLSGLTTPQSGSYNISLDDEPPITLSARSSFNASSPALLFFKTGLDPDAAHKLNVVNAGASSGEESSLLVFGTVNVTTTVAQSGGGAAPGAAMSSHRLPRGTIAAIAVVLSLLVIAAVFGAVLLLRRRRRAALQKESFIVNPTVARRRLSFFTRSAQHEQGGTEKRRQSSNHQRGSSDADILDITVDKLDGDDDDDDDEHSRLQVPEAGANKGRQSRQASQNSNGSYSIDLPELPGRGHVRIRSDGESPSPTHRYVAYVPPNTPPTASPSQRSPKPRGPREMRNTLSAHGRDGSRGILLKQMYSPDADVPIDVQSNDAHSPTTGLDYLPHPTISPLRVNFEDRPNEAEERRRGRFRSGISAVSLPYSLKQALWGHANPPREPESPRTPEVTVTEAIPGPEQAPRYSFLDMESTASQSLSGSQSGSRSTGHSRSTSTRSSSKSGGILGGSEWSARPSIDSASIPPVPPVPNDPRISYGISMTMDGGPTSSRPSLSPDISLQAVPLPPLTITDPSSPRPENTSLNVHPANLPDFLPSPTDSIPLTVSDIHFRHSVQSMVSRVDSRRTSRRLSGAHRAPHPPLPSSPPPQQTEEKPYIVQRLLGQTAGSGPSTPYGTATVSGFGSSSQRGSRGRGGSISGPPGRPSRT